MTTTMTNEIEVMVLQCEHCSESTVVKPSGARLDLITSGLMVVHFFCLHCYELNHLRVGTDFAQKISTLGVPTQVVRVPLEVAEHPHEDLPPISNFQVEKWERLPLKVLNEYAMRELDGELEEL